MTNDKTSNDRTRNKLTEGFVIHKHISDSAYPLRKLHLRGDGPCCCSGNSCCCCWCWGVNFDGVWLPGLPAIPSRPLDSLSISAPKAWRADMAEGGGSLSGSQSSWVSRVVSSVSVDVPDVCCGVPPLPPELLFRRYLFQVPRRSSPVNCRRGSQRSYFY